MKRMDKRKTKKQTNKKGKSVRKLEPSPRISPTRSAIWRGLSGIDAPLISDGSREPRCLWSELKKAAILRLKDSLDAGIRVEIQRALSLFRNARSALECIRDSESVDGARALGDHAGCLLIEATASLLQAGIGVPFAEDMSIGQAKRRAGKALAELKHGVVTDKDKADWQAIMDKVCAENPGISNSAAWAQCETEAIVTREAMERHGITCPIKVRSTGRKLSKM